MLRKNMAEDNNNNNNIRRFMHTHMRMRRESMARLVMQRRPGLHIMGSILRASWWFEVVRVLCFDSSVEERFDDAIRDDLGNGQGSTITVLHDVGDDNHRKRKRAKERQRKGNQFWLAGVTKHPGDVSHMV